MAYTTDAQVLTSLAAHLHHASSTTLTTDASYWSGLATEANDEAYNTIRSVLVGRGYTTAQIDLWDRRVEFNRRLAVCLCLRKGAASSTDIRDDSVAKLCACEEELETVVILIDGESVDIATERIGFGDIIFDTSGGDNFDHFNEEVQL